MCISISSTLVKYEVGQRTAVAIDCNSWGCGECSEKRRKQLRAQALDGAPRKFLTLTSKRTADRTANGAAYELARAWRVLRARIMRRYKLKRLPFIAVFEKTKLGWPHLHILLRAPFLDQHWLSEQMDDITGSPVLKIVAVDNAGRAASYITKYTSKDPHQFGTCKRYWQSQDYRLSEKKKREDKPTISGGWERDTTSLRTWVQCLKLAGWHVQMESVRCAIARAPP
jgi:hypothetical protein